MKVLDTHGNYGTVVRFTGAEWKALRVLAKAVSEEEADE